MLFAGAAAGAAAGAVDSLFVVVDDVVVSDFEAEPFESPFLLEEEE